MLESLNRRFSDIEGNMTPLMVIMLDPCFKDKFFTSFAVRDEAKSLLIEKMNEKLSSHHSSDLPSHHSSDESSVSEPPEKRPQTDVMKCFDEIQEEAGSSSLAITATTGVEQYLVEPNTHYHTGNASTWWDENTLHYPVFSELALQYLSLPPTSVPSERLFSIAGDIYDEKLNRLDPERAKTLPFIKKNFFLKCS